jgi:hypothetical protein
MPKGTTSKPTVEARSYSKKLFFWWSNSPNFWVASRRRTLEHDMVIRIFWEVQCSNYYILIWIISCYLMHSLRRIQKKFLTPCNSGNSCIIWFNMSCKLELLTRM